MLALTRPEKKILITVLSILMALCTLAYLAHRNSQRLLISAEAIETAEEFKYHVLEVQTISTNMDANVHTYVITGDSAMMASNNENIADIFAHLRELHTYKDLTTLDTQQLGQLHSLIDQKTTFVTRAAEMQRTRGQEAAIAYLHDGQQNRLEPHIQEITSSMLARAEAQLVKLKTKNTSVITHFAVTFYLLLLKVSITVITVIFLFFLYFRRRNRAEKALKENQALFQNVLDHTSSVISIKDLSGRYMLINKAYELLLRTKREKVIGKTAHDVFEKEVADAIRDYDLDAIRQKKQINSIEIVPNSDGTQHFTTLRFPLFDGHGIPYAICSISTDETEKALSDRVHQEQMARVLDLFNNAPCGYQATNHDGIIIEMNDTLLHWLGYTREEIVGKMPLLNLLAEESLHDYDFYFHRITSGEVTTLRDMRATYLRKNGSKMPIIINTMAQYDENGDFLYTRTSVFEVSFRKKTEDFVVRN